MHTLPEETIKAFCDNLNAFQRSCFRFKESWKILNEFRRNEDFCDVVLESGGCLYRAHKCVLASVSPYFKAMFLSPLSSSAEQNAINFSHYSHVTIALLLDYIYGVSQSCPAPNVLELLQLADFIQFGWLVDLLVKSIRPTIAISNCVSWYEIGRASGVEKLVVLAKSFIMSNYDEVVNYQHDDDLKYQINEIALLKDMSFNKEVLLCQSDDLSMFLADFSKRKIEKLESSPNASSPFCLKKMFPNIDFLDYENFSICSFFIFNNSLTVLTSYELSNSEHRERGQIDNLLCTVFQLSSYHHTLQEYKNVCYIEPNDISLKSFFNSKLFNKNEKGVMPSYNFTYDTRDSLYLVSQSKMGVYTIHKFSLKLKKLTENWALIRTLWNNLKFVESEALGTLLLEGAIHLYHVENFDFDDNSNHKHQLKELKCTFDWGSNDEASRSEKDKLYKDWEALTYDGQVYLLVVFNDDAHILHILRLDTKTMCWIHLFKLDIPGEIERSFVCEETIVVSIVKGNCSHYYQIDISSKILVDLQMSISVDIEYYHVIPAYFLF